MKNPIKLYSSLSFEQKTTITTKFSIVFNFGLGLGKIILSIFKGVFFMISGIVNFFIMFAKRQCLSCIKSQNSENRKAQNRLIAGLLMIAGLLYGIYMLRFIFVNYETYNYSRTLGICIAAISFVELVVSIIGCFKSRGKGIFFRNIKLINFCSALTAISLTQVALMTFASSENVSFFNGLFGAIVGLIIMIIGFIMNFLPDYDIEQYRGIKYSTTLNDQDMKIQITNSKFYPNYFLDGKIENGVFTGNVIKGRNPIRKLNIIVLIIVIILSEILIFPYALGALIIYFKNQNLLKLMDKKMLDMGFNKE